MIIFAQIIVRYEHEKTDYIPKAQKNAGGIW